LKGVTLGAPSVEWNGASVPLNGLIRVNLIGTALSNQQVANTFYVGELSSNSAPSYDKLQGVAEDLYTWLGTQYRATIHDATTFNRIECHQVADPTVVPPELTLKYVKTVDLPGTRAQSGSTITAQQECALLAFATGIASRKFRGHNFLPPALDIAALNGANWSSTSTYWLSCVQYKARIEAGIEGASSRWTGPELGNWVLVQYSRKARLDGQAWVQTTQAVTLSPEIRWLRSRSKGTI